LYWSPSIKACGTSKITFPVPLKGVLNNIGGTCTSKSYKLLKHCDITLTNLSIQEKDKNETKRTYLRAMTHILTFWQLVCSCICARKL
jgi:hypothetical protein